MRWLNRVGNLCQGTIAVAFIALLSGACSPATPAVPTWTPTRVEVSKATQPRVPTETPFPTLSSTQSPSATPTQAATRTPTPRPKTGIADRWLGKGEEREKLFDAYVQTLKDSHTPTEFGPLGTTWEKELQRARRRFLQADTAEEVYFALTSLQRTMHDLHSVLTLPSELIPAPPSPVALPFTLAVRGTSRASARYVVTASSLPEVKPGFILKQYQGKTPAELEYDFLEWEYTASPERLKVDLARALTFRDSVHKEGPLPDPSLPVLVQFTDPASETVITITTKWAKATRETPRDDYQHLTVDYRGINYRLHKDPANDTLILVYSSFQYGFGDADLRKALTGVSFPVPPFDPAIPLVDQSAWMLKLLQANKYPDAERMKENDVKSYPLKGWLERIDVLNLGNYLNQQSFPNLLMDLRGNGGGNIILELETLLAAKPFLGPMREFAYTPLVRSDPDFQQGMLHFTDTLMRQIILNDLARKTDAPRSQRFPWNCRSKSCNLSEASLEPNRSVKKFNLAIVTGTGCASACDNFTSVMLDNGLAKVVGLPSNGGATPYNATKEFALKNGVKFTLRISAGFAIRPNGESLDGNPAVVEYYLFPEEDYIPKMITYLRRQSFFK